MRQKIDIPGQGQKDGELCEIEESKEPWCEYRLSDGSVIKVKQVATEIWRVIDEFDQEGNPAYFVKSVGVLVVQAPESLKRRSH